MKITSREKALLIADLASEKKGDNIVLMNMKDHSSICEWFVVISANSERMTKALAKSIDKDLSKKKINPIRVEGKTGLSWVLMDYNDVVVHIFYKDIRDFYGLERLWSEVSVEVFEEKCSKTKSPKK